MTHLLIKRVEGQGEVGETGGAGGAGEAEEEEFITNGQCPIPNSQGQKLHNLISQFTMVIDYKFLGILPTGNSSH